MSYILARFPNGSVVPCVIRRAANPFLKIGDKIITTNGNAVCVSEEVGRYSDDDPIEAVAKAMEMNRDFFPVVKGQIEEVIWDEKE